MEAANTTEFDDSVTPGGPSSEGDINSGQGEWWPWQHLPSLHQEYGWTWGWVGACIGILCFGAVGNSYVLFAGLKQTKLRTSQFYVLLLNHSLVCLLLAIVPYPVMLYKGSIGLVKTQAESKLCRVSKLLLLWWITVGLFSNALVAVNRALSCFPHLSMTATKYGHRITAACVALIWILSGLVYVIPFSYRIGWGISMACFPFREMMLHLNHPEVDTTRQVIKYTCGTSLLVALLISVVAYAVIILRLYCQVFFKLSNSANMTLSDQRRREKAHALGVIALVCCTFVTCWAPMMWAIVMKPEALGKPVYSMMAMLETMLNPVLYIITMSAFRPRLCVRNNSVTAAAYT